MRFFAGSCLLCLSILCGGVAAAKSRPHKAMVPPATLGRAGCLDNAQMLSHTAYVPQAGMPPRCGKFLSTDTLLSIRRWDQT